MTETSELLTIRDFVRWTITQFNQNGLYYGHGTENALDEALALILHTLHLSHDVSTSLLDARLTQKEREHLSDLIHRRITKRIPVPYLTNEAWFGGLPFYVDERVLIPRSPIAELIEQHFEPWISADSVHSILDLCTGSGCIAIACAKAFPDATVDASDISADALAVAKMNVLRHEVEDQVHLHQSDLFKSLPAKKYDAIVSNPPYVDAADMASLPPEFHHEPKSGLEAGLDGLDFADRILKDAKNYLSPNGILIVEVGNSEFALAEKYPQLPFTWLEFERGGGGVFLLTAEQLT
jgi:ribosomal protein L3 glutamine methyltransferase